MTTAEHRDECLKHLKAIFGKKLLLTPADIAPIIGRSVSAQAKLRHLNRFPIAQKIEGRIFINIYRLADYIVGNPTCTDNSELETNTPVAKASPKRAIQSKQGRSKPTRRIKIDLMSPNQPHPSGRCIVSTPTDPTNTMLIRSKPTRRIEIDLAC